MKHKHETQGAYLTPDVPDEVYERGEDGHLHLLDIDALLDKGESGLLTEDDCGECIKHGEFAVKPENGVCAQCDLVKEASA